MVHNSGASVGRAQEVCGDEPFRLAEHIRGAKYVELPGADDLYWVGATGAMLDEIEEFLTAIRRTRHSDRNLATILFTDIIGSTPRMADGGDHRSRDLLNRHDEAVRRHPARFRGRQIRSTSKGVVATFDGPARAVSCAIRRSRHTGEVEVVGDGIGGIAVDIAAQVEMLVDPGQVLVSRTVVDLIVGSGIEFADRGEQELRALPGTWRLFAVEG